MVKGSKTSPVVVEGISRLVGIDAEVAYLGGHISGPPSPSKTSRQVEIKGETAGIGAGGGVGEGAGGGVGEGARGGEEVVGAGVGMGGGKQKSTLSPHIQKDNVPTCQL